MNTFTRMKALGKMLLTAISAFAVVACGSGSLNKTPNGYLTAAQVETPANLDGLVTAAYSWLGNDHYTDPNFFWPSGNIRAGDAHKGGNGPGDVSDYDYMTKYYTLTAVSPGLDVPDRYWIRWYDGISRVNSALVVINAVSESTYPNKTTRIGELHFLRGVFYFWLKIHFNQIPWIDETAAPTAVISNTALTSTQLWANIATDFSTAMTNLPKTQPQVGRANFYAAEAYLAKTLLYSAYVQDPTTHAVISMNSSMLSQVATLVTDIEANGMTNGSTDGSSAKIALLSDFSENFDPANDNNPESIFAIQRSVNDNSAPGNGGRGTFASSLNYPVGDSGFGCCGFHIPSTDFVNSFEVDASGLPVQNYNAVPAADYTYENGNYTTVAVDPRLDHTVDLHGKPFKDCTTSGPTCIHDGANWARDPTLYGSNIGTKDLVLRSCSCLVLNGPFFISSLNTVLIRFADVELFKAEALAQLGQGDLGLSIVNSLRARAAASTAKLNTNPYAADANHPTGGVVSLYHVGPYPASAFDNTADAMKAIMRERRLELGLEGFRFFDLVRWGVAAQTIGTVSTPGTYLGDEVVRRPYLSDAKFTPGRDEYFPIPQVEINLSGGVYKQNPGY
jgi:starch-binding outer membrane protein, SusD/RagB family